MNRWQWFLVAWFVFVSLVTVMRIGKPSRPTTARTAVTMLLIYALLAFAVVRAA